MSNTGTAPVPGTAPDVSALVVTWNSAATLGDCLSALNRELSANDEILVFDNGSVDDSPRIAERRGALVHAHGSNIGFAAGMNRLAVDARGDVLVLVNPDVFVQPGAIDSLRSHLPRTVERKIVGGLLTRTTGELEPASARPFPHAASLAGWLLTRRRSKWVIPVAAQEVDAISGAFFATTRELWRELGGFDEGYRHSGEDLDLCWRTRRSGASVWFEPKAQGTHVGGASVRQAPPQIDALRLCGTLRFIRRREGALAASLLRIVLLGRSLFVLVLDMLRVHRLSESRRRRARALVSLALFGERDPRLELPAEPQRS